MKWKNLKNGECPNDGMPLKQIVSDAQAAQDVRLECTVCDFSIGEQKAQALLKKMAAKTQYEPRDNFSALQNMGHERVSEDFSDSPFADRDDDVDYDRDY